MTNKEILSEIDKIKVNIKELEKKVKEENKDKVWEPKEGEKVWFLPADGSIYFVEYSAIYKEYYKMGMVFQTEKEAIRKKFEMQLEKKLGDFALENNESEIDWNNKKTNKVSIYYDFGDEMLRYSSYVELCDYRQVYFTSEEIAQKALDTFEDELIRYFTKEE